jgi:hypothetical protein
MTIFNPYAVERKLGYTDWDLWEDQMIVRASDYDQLLQAFQREQVMIERLKAERDELKLRAQQQYVFAEKMVNERDELRLMLRSVLDSAHPNERDHPRMFPAWQAARKLAGE